MVERMDDSQHQDERFIAALRSGDVGALTVLYRRLNPALIRYLSSQEPIEGEDLGAEAWIDLAASLAKFKGGEGDLRALLFTIARRRLLDFRRKRSRRKTSPTSPETMPDRPDPDDPQDVALVSEGTRRALSLIESLPPDQREVIFLRVIAGLDIDQTAKVVGKRPGTVRVLSHRGLKSLQQRLTKQV